MRRIYVGVAVLVWGILGGAARTGAADARDDAIAVHGFISQGFLWSTPNDVYGDTRSGSFQFNEFGLAVLTQLSDRLRAGAQFLSRDLGDVGNNAIAVDWAVADYRWRDWLGIRGGLVKFPWGFYNETRDIDMLRTSIFLPSSLYYERDREVYSAMQGMALYGSVSLRRFGVLHYQFHYGDKSASPESMNGMDEFGQVFAIETFDVRDIYLGTLEWETPLSGVRLRQTTGEYAWRLRGAVFVPFEWGRERYALDKTGRQRFAITSADYTTDRFALALESRQVWNTGDEYALDESADDGGWYVGGSYRLTDRLELGAYYSVYYRNGDDPAGQFYEEYGLPAYLAWQKDLALTLRVDVGEYLTLKLEGHYLDGAAMLPQKWPELPERNTLLLAAKVTVNF